MSSSEAIRLTIAATMETNHDLAVRYLLEAIKEDPTAVFPSVGRYVQLYIGDVA